LLRKNGTPMHDEFDLIIGVTAVANEMILVTDNIKDFRYLENLKTGWKENNLPVTAPKKTWGARCQGKGLFPELTLAKLDRKLLRNAPRFIAETVSEN
jgi:hypothetical protein